MTSLRADPTCRVRAINCRSLSVTAASSSRSKVVSSLTNATRAGSSRPSRVRRTTSAMCRARTSGASARVDDLEAGVERQAAQLPRQPGGLQGLVDPSANSPIGGSFAEAAGLFPGSEAVG